jgi:hypothetical protein
MDGTFLQKSDKPTNGKAISEVKGKIVWKNVIGQLTLHLMGLYGLYVYIISAKLLTWVYGKFKTNIFIDLYIFT